MLATAGLKVHLFDRRFDCPDLFRAEKIEPDQADLMRRYGLLELRSPLAPRIGSIRRYSQGDGSETLVDTVDQYGIDYGETVNSLIRQLPQSVRRIRRTVTRFAAGRQTPAVVTDDGVLHRADLVVLATGGSTRLAKAAGVRRLRDPSLRSLSFGFDIEPRGGSFAFSGFNYHLKANEQLIDYLTIFRIGNRFRVNLFSQMDVREPIVRSIRNDPKASLEHWFPRLQDMIGRYRVVSKVQVVPTSYARLDRPWKAGLIIIGEEHQTVSPTTGTGLSRILNDVDALARSLPRLMVDGDGTHEHLKTYYHDPAKVEADRRSAGAWMHYRDQQLGPKGLRRRVQNRLQLWRIR